MRRFTRLSIFTALTAAVLACATAASASGAAPTAPSVSRDELSRTHLTAATAAAQASLRDQILRFPVSPGLTVQEFVGRTAGDAALSQTLATARQVGGPRWLDDQTCQIQIELPGQSLTRVLTDLAARNPRTTPVSVEALSDRLAPLADRTFSATGTSASALALDGVRPAAMVGPWAGASEDVRRQSVALARDQAVRAILDSVAPVALTDGRPIGALLADPPTARAVAEWVATRPITRVDFREDGKVEVTLAVAPADLADQIVSAGSVSLDDAAIRDLRQRVTRAMAKPIGVAGLPDASEKPAAALEIPRRPPAWAREQLDTAGVASGPGSRLRAARTAEGEAQRALRDKVLQLPLTASMTVGQAAEASPAVARAVDRALQSARTYRADYHSDGRVEVRVSVDLRDLWAELIASP